MRKVAVLLIAGVLSLGLAIPAHAADPVTPAPSASVTATPAPVTSSPTLTTRLAVESIYAQGQGKATDKHGVAQSLYTGKWYSKKAERKRLCIVRK